MIADLNPLLRARAMNDEPPPALPVFAPPGALVPTLLADATLELLAEAPRPLKSRDRVRFHVGTHEVMARVLEELGAPAGRRDARWR